MVSSKSTNNSVPVKRPWRSPPLGFPLILGFLALPQKNLQTKENLLVGIENDAVKFITIPGNYRIFGQVIRHQIHS